MPARETSHDPEYVRRDPLSGEAATPPNRAVTDDPTHGVDPGAPPPQSEEERLMTQQRRAFRPGALWGGVLVIALILLIWVLV